MSQLDELGAHVSTSGGLHSAPARARLLNSKVLQLFTKRPAQWSEPEITIEAEKKFKEEREKNTIETIVSHDSYLINLSSPKADLYAKSLHSFKKEVERCNKLGIEFIVSHPGNATDKDKERGLKQNAEGISEALRTEGGDVIVLLETTAGQGNVLGSTFEELETIISLIPEDLRHRVGICLDTCHVWAAGYDIKSQYERVVADIDRTVGLDRLKLFHLNDSQGDIGTHKDRHANIGEGTLGEEPFRSIILDPRFTNIPKVLETPKGDDDTASDLRNLGLLRNFRTT